MKEIDQQPKLRYYDYMPYKDKARRRCEEDAEDCHLFTAQSTSGLLDDIKRNSQQPGMIMWNSVQKTMMPDLK